MIEPEQASRGELQELVDHLVKFSRLAAGGASYPNSDAGCLKFVDAVLTSAAFIGARNGLDPDAMKRMAAEAVDRVLAALAADVGQRGS